MSLRFSEMIYLNSFGFPIIAFSLDILEWARARTTNPLYSIKQDNGTLRLKSSN